MVVLVVILQVSALNAILDIDLMEMSVRSAQPVDVNHVQRIKINAKNVSFSSSVTRI